MTNEATKISKFAHYAVGVCAAIATLSGCGGSQISPSGPTQGAAQSVMTAQSLVSPFAQANGAMAVHPDPSHSWMAPDAKRQNLLYISDIGTYDVYVYSYPKGALEGTLTGLSGPEGECVDKRGDIFIANFSTSSILEYAHGGTSPIANLSDPGYYPAGCSIDPTTGNLAVTNYVSTSNGQGNVVIYQGAKGNPKEAYADSVISEMGFCGYDDAGNLFVDGSTSGNAFAFAELPSGGTSLKNISLNRSIGLPGGVQWDGAHVAVGDRKTNVIHQFTISGTKGQEAGTTPLTGASDVDQFWIEGPNVVGSDPGAANAMFWNYPAGGSATKTVAGLHEPIGATVSEGK
jgi:hypothetical protein